MYNSQYRHIQIIMGIPYYNITSGKYIQIITDRPIFNISTSGIILSTISITEGISQYRMQYQTSSLQSITMEP